MDNCPCLYSYYISQQKTVAVLSANTFSSLLQQIDEMLAGALTQEDEDAVLAELEAITQVGVKLHV